MSCRLGLRRHGPASQPEQLVVGDSGFRVLTCGLTEHGPRGRSPKLDDAVDRFTTGRSSQWEGVTADGSGRVFILEEHPGHVFVLSPDLDRLDEALEHEGRYLVSGVLPPEGATCAQDAVPSATELHHCFGRETAVAGLPGP